ncbi:MAG: DUF1573 domain-containing protein [Deltaproteobacteria bacterium]|nr:DUF1573 domain-containing protein [Deltaproteobacteria bacterium]
MKKQWRSRCSSEIPRQTKSVWLGIVLILLFSSSLFSYAWAQESMSPQIVIPEKNFQFEPVEQGQSIEHTFTVLNKGREPLQIIKVKPG